MRRTTRFLLLALGSSTFTGLACNGGADDAAPAPVGAAGSFSAGSAGASGKAGSATSGKGGGGTGQVGGAGQGGAQGGNTQTGGKAGASAGAAGNAPKDTTAPTFGGITSAMGTSETTVLVGWSPAADDVSAPSSIAYRIFAAAKPAAIDFTKARVVTPAGAKGAVVTGLEPGKSYVFAVRAVDAAGNQDANEKTLDVSTSDASPPVFAGVAKVESKSPTSVDVTWNAAMDNGTAPDKIKYRVFSAKTPGGQDFTKPAQEVVGATTAKLTGLTELSQNYVVVRAVDAAGNEDKNVVEKSAQTADGTPPTFAGAKSATAFGTSITVDWDSATDNFELPAYIAYDVFVSKTTGGFDFTKPTFTTPIGGTAPVTSHTFVNLDVATKYFFVVRARDSAGNGEKNTKEASASTAASADVTAPIFAGLSAINVLGPTSIELVWNPATDDTTPQGSIVYDIYNASTSGGETYATPSFSTKPGETQATITALAPKTTGFYVVRARDLAGNQDTNTVEQSSMTPADTTAPTFAGADSASAQGPTSIRVSWTAANDDVDPASSLVYSVYVSTTGTFDFSTPALVTQPGETSAVIGGLDASTPYQVVVRVTDTTGNQDVNQNAKSVTTDADKTPPTFAGVTVAKEESATTVHVYWNNATDDVDSPGQISYEIYVGTKTGQEDFGAPIAVPAGQIDFVVTGLVPKTPYFFVVRAKDRALNLDTNLTEATATTMADTNGPTFDGVGFASGVTPTTATVNWTAATDDASTAANITYEVCRSTSVGGCAAAWAVAGTVKGATSFPFTGLTPTKDYYFVVRAVDEAGNYDAFPAAPNAVELKVTAQADTQPPTFAGITSATPQSATSVLVQWAAPATDNVTPTGSIQYEVFAQGTQPACNAAGNYVFPTIPLGASSFLVTGLSPNTGYTFWVRARDGAGLIECNAASATTATPADTTAPSTVAVNTTTPINCGVTIGFAQATDDVTQAASMKYRVCYSTSAAACTGANFTTTWTGLGKPYGNPATLQYTASNLNMTQTYYFGVRAEDQAGNASASNVATAAIAPDDTVAPASPTGVTRLVKYGNPAAQVQVSWSSGGDNCGATYVHYNVCWTGSSSGCAPTADGVLSFTVGNAPYTLLPDSSYSFTVTAVDSQGNASAAASAGVAVTTGISHASHIQPIYDTYCASCHGWNYGTTVGGNGAACGEKIIPVGGDANCDGTAPIYSTCNSRVFNRIGVGRGAFAPSCASDTQMPPVGYAIPSATDFRRLGDWIRQGAINN